MESSVDLPQPEGPAMETYSRRADGEMNPGEGVRFHFVGEEHFCDAVEFNERILHGRC